MHCFINHTLKKCKVTTLEQPFTYCLGMYYAVFLKHLQCIIILLSINYCLICIFVVYSLIAIYSRCINLDPPCMIIIYMYLLEQRCYSYQECLV